ncbi:TetR/AcrR family transcriptional regulator [Chitinimonas naiadis]
MAGVRQFDEEATLKKALALFWEKGYRATSMLDLAQATGVQRGSLYNAYRDKEALFLRAYEQYSTRFLADTRTAFETADLRAALTAFFKLTVDTMTAGQPSHGCLTTKTATDLDAGDQRLHTAVQERLDRLEATIAEQLAGHTANLALPPTAAARLIVTYTRGLAVMERVYGNRERLDDSAASLIQLLVRA